MALLLSGASTTCFVAHAVSARQSNSRVLMQQAPAAETVPLQAPGIAEDGLFDCDASVAIWKEFQRDGPASASENLARTSEIASVIASTGDGARYAVAHGIRTGYFAANAVLGTLAFELHERLRGGGQSDEASVTSIAGFGNVGGLGVDGAVASRLLLEAAMCFEQDFGAIRSGLYREPWDMYTRGHRQLTPQYAARQTSRFVREAIGTLGRRARGDETDIGIWLDAAPGLYPEYYKNNFHYQTDGWMSARSAQVYETSTETLFVGRQDAMQRLTLRPLREVASACAGAPRILEVACGTGRFATFVRDNYPDAPMTAVDLSPFYLEKARENDDYWRKARKGDAPPAARFVQAAAEDLPFDDGAFDAVCCASGHVVQSVLPCASASHGGGIGLRVHTCRGVARSLVSLVTPSSLSRHRRSPPQRPRRPRVLLRLLLPPRGPQPGKSPLPCYEPTRGAAVCTSSTRCQRRRARRRRLRWHASVLPEASSSSPTRCSAATGPRSTES